MGRKSKRKKIQAIRSQMGSEETFFIKRFLRSIDPHCLFCRKELKFKDSTLDHLIPLAKGGCNKIFNLALCCEDCNKAKANRITGAALAELNRRGMIKYAAKFKKKRDLLRQ